MADWPGTDELKQVLDVDQQTDVWTDTLDRAVAAAIDRVKHDVADWDEGTDEPDAALASAALRAAVVLQVNGVENDALLDKDGIYQSYLKGHRRRFALA